MQQKLTLLVTHPHPCSYLPEQQASTAFVDPTYQITPFLFSRLAEIGFVAVAATSIARSARIARPVSRCACRCRNSSPIANNCAA